MVSDVAPADILTRFDPVANPDRAPSGLAHANMTGGQQNLLERLIRLYLGRAPTEPAATSWHDVLDAGIEYVTFAWAGPSELGHGHYYAVRGPTFLIEYDNTQDNANHIHSVWRDLRHDWGEDLLAAPYAHHHHEASSGRQLITAAPCAHTANRSHARGSAVRVRCALLLDRPAQRSQPQQLRSLDELADRSSLASTTARSPTVRRAFTRADLEHVLVKITEREPRLALAASGPKSFRTCWTRRSSPEGRGALEQKNQLLVNVYKRRGRCGRSRRRPLSHVDRVSPLMVEHRLLLGHALDDGRTVLLEGVRRRCWMLIMARYPFVTRPIRRRVAPCTGSGHSADSDRPVIAVVKATPLEWGGDRFPPIVDADGDRLTTRWGAEFGTTTGRPRRCGWYDVPIARYGLPRQRCHRRGAHQARCPHAGSGSRCGLAYDIDGAGWRAADDADQFHHAAPVYAYSMAER